LKKEKQMGFLVQRNPVINFSVKTVGTKDYLSLDLVSSLWNEMFRSFREIIPR
jgi:hypothetical protein